LIFNLALTAGARLTAAGHWHEGDPNVLIVMDSGYDVTRLAFVLADLPVDVLGRLTHRGCWLAHDGALPVIEGTLIRLHVDRLPGDRDPKPLWLWSSTTGATDGEIDRCWQSFLRRFDLEHTFRLFKQTLGWTAPKIRTPQAADRWTWLSSSPPTPSSASPGHWPATCAVPGRNPPRQPG
jgi:hypothetical protein